MKQSQVPPYQVSYDLSNCDAEPIHLIRHYQAHATLIAVDMENMLIKACSDNLCGQTKLGLEELLGLPLQKIMHPDAMEAIHQVTVNKDYSSRNPIHLPYWRNDLFPNGANMLLHETDSLLVIEIEPRQPEASSANFLHKIDQSLQHIQASGSSSQLFDLVVREVRLLTGFDRVMLYRFDEVYNGEVIAEAKKEGLTPFLNLRYPHTDIPAQARKLQVLNQIRHLVSTSVEAVDAVRSVPELKDVNLSRAANRGSSPIHLEYLKNMGVGATFTIGLIVEEKLWGLIACHHNTSKFVDYRLRSMLNFMGKVLSGHLALQQSAEFRRQQLQTSIIRSRLFERMNESYNIVDALSEDNPSLLDLTNAEGAAIVLENTVTRLGHCPSEETLVLLVQWLSDYPKSIYSTNDLMVALPKEISSRMDQGGMLSIRLGRDPLEFIFWFRPKIVKTIEWGGNPTARKIIKDKKVRLHPELSFEKWKEEVSEISEKWHQYQIDAATSLRNDIKEVILLKYQEVRKANQQLVEAYDELESFSYTVSHDLRAPLRSIKGFAEILEEDYADKLDDYGRSALSTIVSSVGKMNHFINDILAFSRLGRTGLTVGSINLEKLIREIWKMLGGISTGVELRLDLSSPEIEGDYTNIKQLLMNLLSNSVKYARKDIDNSWVSVQTKVSDLDVNKLELIVEDNGIGFKMRHAKRIFAVFHRLVSDEQYEGTGVGLAIAKRIVTKHQGTIEVESEPNLGTRFTIIMPVKLLLDTPDNSEE